METPQRNPGYAPVYRTDIAATVTLKASTRHRDASEGLLVTFVLVPLEQKYL